MPQADETVRSDDHEGDGDRACSTKLLWTRVQNGVTKALAGTTLAELVEFSEPHPHPAASGHGKATVVHAV